MRWCSRSRSTTACFMLTMCERRWSWDIHHKARREEGFGLLLICYVSDLSKEVGFALAARRTKDARAWSLDAGRRRASKSLRGGVCGGDMICCLRSRRAIDVSIDVQECVRVSVLCLVSIV